MFSRLAYRSFSSLNTHATKPSILASKHVTPPITSYKDVGPALEPYRIELMSHPLYTTIQSVEEIQFFMESHVFAVWDFMSLLKSLQLKLTCLTLPWVPPKDPILAYFVNSIVVSEETDDFDTLDYKNATSHYLLYLKSMEEVGANTAAITHFVGKIQNGEPWRKALAQTKTKFTHIPVNTFEFVEFTLNVVENGSVPEIASSFLFGREDPIPLMYQKLLARFDEKNIQCPNFRSYLNRHVEVDGGRHAPLAGIALEHLCTDAEKAEKAFLTARDSINMRIHLWEGVYNKIK